MNYSYFTEFGRDTVSTMIPEKLALPFWHSEADMDVKVCFLLPTSPQSHQFLLSTLLNRPLYREIGLRC